MGSKAEQFALIQALERLSSLSDLPSQGAAVLDMSGDDADFARFFVDRGCETARLSRTAIPSQGITLIDAGAGATGLPNASLDMTALAGDRARKCDPEVLFESSRILKSQALLILSYASPICLPGTVANLSENLMLQFNPFWSIPADVHAIAPHLSHLTMSGFVGAECHSLDISLSFTREEWINYCCNQKIIEDAGLSPAEMQDFRLVLNDYIRRDFGNMDFFVSFRALTYMAFKGG